MPLFSRTGEVFFIGYEGQARHIFRINQDGRGLQKLIAEQVGALVSISPDGRWIVAATDVDESQTRQSVIAYSLQGAYARVLYRKSGIGSLDTQSSPYISWSADQKAIYFARSSDQIKTIVVPVSPSEAFPRFSGNQLDDDRLLSKISGARVLERTAVFPGPKIGVYAISRTTMQRNLYRIGLPSP
jgi:Tol biopolymer transport system component